MMAATAPAPATKPATPITTAVEQAPLAVASGGGSISPTNSIILADFDPNNEGPGTSTQAESPNADQNAPGSRTFQAACAEILLSIGTTIISGITFGSAVTLQVLKYNFILPAILVIVTNVLTAIAVGLVLSLAAAYFIYRPQSSSDQKNISMPA